MREKFMRFMQGRYGMDHLGRSVVGAAILAFVLSFFFENAIFPLLAWAGIIYAYFRMFSGISINAPRKIRPFWPGHISCAAFSPGRKTCWPSGRPITFTNAPPVSRRSASPEGRGALRSAAPNATPGLSKTVSRESDHHVWIYRHQQGRDEIQRF